MSQKQSNIYRGPKKDKLLYFEKTMDMIYKRKKTYKLCKDIEGSKPPKWPFCMGGPTKMKVSHECQRRRLRSLKAVINGTQNRSMSGKIEILNIEKIMARI